MNIRALSPAAAAERRRIGLAGTPKPAFSSVAFSVPIVPVGKGRARFGKGRVYTPAKTVAAERAIAIHARAAMRSRAPHPGPVALTVRAVLPIPADWPKWRKAAAREKRIFPTGKPDASNVLKLVEDALNGIVWIDDAQVVSEAIHKDYGEPGIEIEVFAINTEEAMR